MPSGDLVQIQPVWEPVSVKLQTQISFRGHDSVRFAESPRDLLASGQAGYDELRRQLYI